MARTLEGFWLHEQGEQDDGVDHGSHGLRKVIATWASRFAITRGPVPVALPNCTFTHSTAAPKENH